VLLIALTNHALDHMLSSVLEKKITSKIVRLGSRSADEQISRYNLDQMEMAAGKSRLDRAFGVKYRALKQVEEALDELMKRFLRREVHSNQLIRHLELEFPEEHELIMHDPPEWVATLYAIMNQDDGEGAWNTVSNAKEKEKEKDNTLYAFWSKAMDLDFLRPSPVDRPSDNEKGKRPVANQFDALRNLKEEGDKSTEESSDDEGSNDENSKLIIF
jgi:hypothetical protein